MRQYTDISHSKFFLIAFKIHNKSEQVLLSHCLVPDYPNYFSNCPRIHLPRIRHRIVQHDIWVNTRQHRNTRKRCISNLGSATQPPFPQSTQVEKPTSLPPLQKHSHSTNHPYQIQHDTYPHRTQRRPTHPYYTPSLPPTSPLRIPTPPPTARHTYHMPPPRRRSPSIPPKPCFKPQNRLGTNALHLQREQANHEPGAKREPRVRERGRHPSLHPTAFPAVERGNVNCLPNPKVV